MKGFCMRTTPVRFAMAIAAAATTSATPALAGEEDRTVIVRPKTAIVERMANAVIFDDANHVIEMRVENGAVTVMVDGEEIAQDRIRNEDGQVIVLDEDGNPMKSLHLFLNPGEHDFVFAMPAGKGKVDWQFQGPRPNVMLGVHLTQPGPALRKHLKLDPGEGMMIGGLFEGLPAHNAGLRQYDIIISVDGNRVDDPGSIREALQDLEDGDEVTLGVIQEGRRKQFDVTVEDFDSARMDPSVLIGGGTGARLLIPNLEFELQPGHAFRWRDFLVDPGSKDIFRWRTDDFRSRRESPDNGIGDEQLDRLNLRMEELRDLIDQLVEESRTRDR